MSNEVSKDVSVFQSPLALTAKQLANCLAISLRHCRRLDSAQKIPSPIRLGRSCRWPVQEIQNWMDAGAPDRQRWETMKGARDEQ